MGIGYHVVEALIRESKFRPIDGDVLLIGRQTVYFTSDGLLKTMSEHGLTVSPEERLRLDSQTVSRRSHEHENTAIADTELFRVLGARKVLALDHSNYEGAEVVHDLTKPIPEHLRESADFILDGSTIDNVFDPASVITNYAELLRPGGRLITTNNISNHHQPYVMLPPLWYLDYFTANGFVDCKVYIVTYGKGEIEGHSIADVFTIDLDALMDPARTVSSFVLDRELTSVVLAEKGPRSTSHLRPIQQHYRSEAEWKSYRASLAKIRESHRHHLVRTQHPITVGHVSSGHLFIDQDFTARDPLSEYLAMSSQGRVYAE